jgi:hypothetical protein
MTEEASVTIEQKEYIKLSRGMKGAYGFEIKLLDTSAEGLKRLDEIVDELEGRYGSDDMQ